MQPKYVLVLAAIALAGCGRAREIQQKKDEERAKQERREKQEEAKWAATPEAKKAAIAELEEGPTVKTARYTSEGNVEMLVEDDGTDRSGLAGTGCSTLREHEAVGAESIYVFVKDEAGKRTLGDQLCTHHTLDWKD